MRAIRREASRGGNAVEHRRRLETPRRAAVGATAALLVSLGLPSAAEALTRCEVLDHAKRWVDEGIMYSQGPYGGYCSGSMYCDPDAGGACYRPDCSGYVSAVWQLDAPGNTTYSFASGPWDDGVSYVIGKDELAPGDALNWAGNPSDGTGHIRLFGGWSNDDHSRLWGYETSTCNTPAHRWEKNWSEMGGYVPIRLKSIQECAPPKPPVKLGAQLTGNGAIGVVNWEADEHVEVWVKGSDAGLYHSWTPSNDTWSPLSRITEGASCGFAPAYRFAEPGYAEVFLPNAAGKVLRTWFEDDWRAPADLGGAGLSRLSTLAWPDGRVAVFAWGSDGAIWYNAWSADSAWAGWSSLGGQFTTGPTAIAWEDGHAELFATGRDGAAWHRSWRLEAGFGEWDSSLGGELTSRPVPVRWDDGRVDLFARGRDGYLQHASFVDGNWQSMQRLGGTPIVGEPSAIFNPKDAGGPFGAQVVARGADDELVELHWDGSSFTELAPMLQDAVLGSDPFAWVRGDGAAMVFAIDADGRLLESHRAPDGGFHAWAHFDGPTVDACVLGEQIPPGDEPGGGGASPGADAGGGRQDAGAGEARGGGSADAGAAGTSGGEGSDSGGCSVAVLASGAPRSAWWILGASSVVALRRRGARRRRAAVGA